MRRLLLHALLCVVTACVPDVRAGQAWQMLILRCLMCLQSADAHAAISAAVQLLPAAGSHEEASAALRDFCRRVPSITASCSSMEQVYGALLAMQVGCKQLWLMHASHRKEPAWLAICLTQKPLRC